MENYVATEDIEEAHYVLVWNSPQDLKKIKLNSVCNMCIFAEKVGNNIFVYKMVIHAGTSLEE